MAATYFKAAVHKLGLLKWLNVAYWRAPLVAMQVTGQFS